MYTNTLMHIHTHTRISRDFRGIYQECATVLYDEIDYINEGRNAGP